MQEKEDLKEIDNSWDEDPTCYDTTHNGREVRVCICTSDKCNSSPKLNLVKNYLLMTLTVAALVFAYQ